jgi:hypothetical protein
MGIGELKVKLHRPIAGEIKTVTLKKRAGSGMPVLVSLFPTHSRCLQPATQQALMWGLRALPFSVTGQRSKIPGITKPHRRSFAGCNERYPGGKEPAIGAGGLSSS